MPKLKCKCFYCGNEFIRDSWKIKTEKQFCNKSCYRSYENVINNPSLTRDLSGKNNPMFGKHKVAWNKDLKGKDCHNWKGGIHKRKDGYFRINIDGVRFLYHRYILGINDNKVVHHLDENPSNNSIDNLVVCKNQSEHIKKYHNYAFNRITKNTSKR
jgi:hypothetical protein